MQGKRAVVVARRLQEIAMGWLFMSSLDGHTGPREYLDAQFTFDRPDRSVRVLRSALLSIKTYYGALEVIKVGQPRRVCAIVCLVRYSPRDRRGDLFGYKDMDETMGPYEARCPAAILDLLTPTDSVQANEWRERCRAALAGRVGKPKLRDGATIVFAQPIAFTDGRSFERLTVSIDPRQPRAVRFRSSGSSALYRISGLKNRDYRVEP